MYSYNRNSYSKMYKFKFTMFVSIIFSFVIMSGYCLKDADQEGNHDRRRAKLDSIHGRRYHPRIVGGKITSIEDHPHHANLFYTNKYTNDNMTCGGSIISSSWILTAAHCRGKSMIVWVGSNVIHKGNQHRVKRKVLFPRHRTYIEYDIMLLQLRSNLSFNRQVQPVKLGSWSDIIDGVMANVTGFGTTSENGERSEYLRVTQLPVIKDCHKDIFIHEFCAGYNEGGRDSCQGDSGSGLVVSEKLIGIVAYGTGCARPLEPGVYSSVPYAAQWICRVTGICADSTRQ